MPISPDAHPSSFAAHFDAFATAIVTIFFLFCAFLFLIDIS